MLDVLCQDCISGPSNGREIDLPAHILTPNDNTAASRANHRKKQRFQSMPRRAARARRLCVQTAEAAPPAQYVASFGLSG
jgi:hypothetical protein